MRSRFAWAVVALFAPSGCFPPDDGREPPLEEFYFPVGLATDPDATRLYVANSDFDLQFNAGTLQVYDLDRLRSFLPQYCEADSDCSPGEACDLPGAATNRGGPSHFCVDPADPKPCGRLGEKDPPSRLLAPGRCDFLDPTAPPGGGPSLLLDSVKIGAFVTDIVYRQPPQDALASGSRARLFMPVRGDATLHWVDVLSGGELDCGQGSSNSCDANHRRGDEPAEENTRDIDLPPEPFGIAADERGEAILVTHQVDGQVALFVNDWENGPAGGPRLEFVLGGLPAGALGIASVPEPAAVIESEVSADQDPLPHEPGFLVTFRNSPQVRLVRFFDDAAADPARPFLEASRATTITALSQGFDSRGVAVDPSPRRRCEQECPIEDLECLLSCAAIPLGVYLANRAPQTLLVGQTRVNDSVTSSDDLPEFFDALPVAVGPSRVVVGDVRGRGGEPLRRVFVVCFSSRKIFVYDPIGRRFEKVIETGRGPHALTIDPVNSLGYIGHFTDSYIGVVDLDQSHSETYGEIVLTVGPPTAPRASR